jgi:hypothetical protein
MFSLRIAVDDDELRNLMAQWMVKKRKTIIDGLITVARTTCKAFMEYTLPSEPTKMVGRVATEIRRAYASPSRVFLDIRKKDQGAADAFWYFQKIGKYSTAQKIMQADSPSFSELKFQPFDGGAAHKAARGARGRVARSTQPAFVTKGSGGKLSKYIAGRQARVGMAKAGWVAAWRDLGRVRDVPQWVRRAEKATGGTLGSADKQFQGEASKHIILHNHILHSDDAFTRHHRAMIEQLAANNLVKYFLIQLSK